MTCSVGCYVIATGLLISIFTEFANSSGYLLVGFVLYEFSHFVRQPSNNVTTISVQSASIEANGSSISGVPWQLRSVAETDQQQRQASTEESLDNVTNNVTFPWLHETKCNTTSPSQPMYRFLLCLDGIDKLGRPPLCQFNRLQTDALPLGAPSISRDIVIFPSTLGRTSDGIMSTNPTIFRFQNWTGGVRISVFVKCCGVKPELKGLCAEILMSTVISSPAPSRRQLQPQYFILQGMGRLTLQVMLQCDDDFYGPQCTSFCRVQNPLIEHAYCNPTNGQRQCIQGWEGPDCQYDIDECRHGYCQNGAQCLNFPPGSFTCKCPLGTVGRFCQVRIAVCHTKPCQNGGSCSDSSTGFICSCTPDFTGYYCETRLPRLTERLKFSDSTTNSVEDYGQAGNTNHQASSDARSFLSSTLAVTDEMKYGLEDWHIVVIVITVAMTVPLSVVAALVIRGRYSRYIISKSHRAAQHPARPNSFSNGAYQRDHIDNQFDVITNNSNIDRHPNIVHLHRNPLIDSTDIDRHPNIVYLHRNPLIDSTDVDRHPNIVYLHRNPLIDSTDVDRHPNIVHPHRNISVTHDNDDRYPYIVHPHRTIVEESDAGRHPNKVHLHRTVDNGSERHQDFIGNSRFDVREMKGDQLLSLAVTNTNLLWNVQASDETRTSTSIAFSNRAIEHNESCSVTVMGVEERPSMYPHVSYSPGSDFVLHSSQESCDEALTTLMSEQCCGECFYCVPSQQNLLPESSERHSDNGGVFAIGGTLVHGHNLHSRSEPRKSKLKDRIKGAEQIECTRVRVGKVDSSGYEVPQVRHRQSAQEVKNIDLSSHPIPMYYDARENPFQSPFLQNHISQLQSDSHLGEYDVPKICFRPMPADYVNLPFHQKGGYSEVCDDLRIVGFSNDSRGDVTMEPQVPEEPIYEEVMFDVTGSDPESETLSLLELGICTAVPPRQAKGDKREVKFQRETIQQ